MRRQRPGGRVENDGGSAGRRPGALGGGSPVTSVDRSPRLAARRRSAVASGHVRMAGSFADRRMTGGALAGNRRERTVWVVVARRRRSVRGSRRRAAKDDDRECRDDPGDDPVGAQPRSATGTGQPRDSSGVAPSATDALCPRHSDPPGNARSSCGQLARHLRQAARAPTRRRAASTGLAPCNEGTGRRVTPKRPPSWRVAATVGTRPHGARPVTASPVGPWPHARKVAAI
jgi:hypothetical protein